MNQDKLNRAKEIMKKIVDDGYGVGCPSVYGLEEKCEPQNCSGCWNYAIDNLFKEVR